MRCAAVGDIVIAAPHDALAPRIACFVRVTAPHAVTVSLNNLSASAVNPN